MTPSTAVALCALIVQTVVVVGGGMYVVGSMRTMVNMLASRLDDHEHRLRILERGQVEDAT